MPLLTMTTPNRHDGAVALVNAAVNNPGSAAGKEVSRLLIEVKKEVNFSIKIVCENLHICA
jgi:hypothetical protein